MSDLTPPPEGERPGSIPGRPDPAPPPQMPPSYPPQQNPAAQFPSPQMPPPPTPPPRYPPRQYPPPGAPYGYVAVPLDRFGRPLAAWWQRLLAIILDSLILSIPKGFIFAIAFGSSVAGGGFTTGTWGVSVLVLGMVFAVIDLAYFALLNGSEKGQTVGQMALGITVRDEFNGGALGTQRAGLRILVLYPGILLGWVPILGAIAGIYTLVAGLSPLWDSRRQGFHDKVAHTDVIKVR